MPGSFPFFDYFIPSHTVDFTAENEVAARIDITSRFLDAFPVADAGFEFVVFPNKLAPRDIDVQVERFRGAARQLQHGHRVKVHASMHFPTKNNLDLFLGSPEPDTRKRVLALFDQCLDLAVAAGIRTVVVHSGANINNAAWIRMKDDYQVKQRQLTTIAERIREMLGACVDKGFKGKLAWENVPWPFDIPDTLTYTNIIPRDFTIVLAALEAMAIPNLDQLGICADLCHSWIVERVARLHAHRPRLAGQARVPPGVFAAEEPDFLALADMSTFIGTFGERITHVHLADSSGELELESDGVTCKRQPSEGAELGTGDFCRSPALSRVLKQIAAGLRPREKILCTLEVKDADFSRPEKAYRSLLFLGNTFFKKK